MYKKDLDFYASYKLLGKKQVYKERTSNIIILLASLIVIAGGTYTGVMYMDNLSTRKQIDELDSEIARVTEENMRLVVLRAELIEIDTLVRTVEMVNETVDSKQMLTKEHIDMIDEALGEDVKVVNAAYDAGKMTFECESTLNTTPADAAEALNNIGIKTDVTYSGYSLNKLIAVLDGLGNQVEQEGDELITFTLLCEIDTTPVIETAPEGGNNGEYYEDENSEEEGV